MRDDLHKTVPLPRRWGRVLLYLSKQRWTGAELAPLIVETVQKDLMDGEQIGGRRLDEALAEGDVDLFDDREERMRLTLMRIQEEPLSTTERSTCEIALGVLSIHGMTGDFRKRVKQAAGTAHARDQLEHMASRVALTHGSIEASQVRRVVLSSLKLCDFTLPRDQSVFRRRKTLGEFLSMPLPLGD